MVVAGKGDQDWTEVSDGRGGSIRVCLSASTGTVLSQRRIDVAAHTKCNLANDDMLSVFSVPSLHGTAAVQSSLLCCIAQLRLYE